MSVFERPQKFRKSVLLYPALLTGFCEWLIRCVWYCLRAHTLLNMLSCTDALTRWRCINFFIIFWSNRITGRKLCQASRDYNPRFRQSYRRDSFALFAYTYNMLKKTKSVTFFEKIFKIFFCSPGYTKPSVQSVTFLRRLSRLPASHPALPGISRCKTRRELKCPRCGNTHISSDTLAYAGAGRMLPLLLRGLYLLHI